MPLDDRQMRVPEENCGAAGETAAQAVRPAIRGAGDVDEAERGAARLENELLRQLGDERRLVDVAVDGVHGRPDRPELLEERDGGEVAQVEDEICRAKPVQTRLGEPAGSPRKVRVRDSRDEHGRVQRRRTGFWQGACLDECFDRLQTGIFVCFGPLVPPPAGPPFAGDHTIGLPEHAARPDSKSGADAS